MKRFLITAAFALALTGSEACAGGGMAVRFGPPPPPRELMVARPGPRYVWVPGYYRWNRGRYVWANGYWAVPPRHRSEWVPGRWEPRRGGYIWVQGRWR